MKNELKAALRNHNVAVAIKTISSQNKRLQCGYQVIAPGEQCGAEVAEFAN